MKASNLPPDKLREILLTMPDLEVAKWVHTKIHHNPKLRLLTRVIDSIADLSAALESLHEEARQTESSLLPDMLDEYFLRHGATDAWAACGFEGSMAIKAYSDEVSDIHIAAGKMLEDDPDLMLEIMEAKRHHAKLRDSEIPDAPQNMSDDLVDMMEAIAKMKPDAK